MRKRFLVLAWIFVFSVAAYDVYFAWRYRAVFEVWEMNPVARWAAQCYGFGAVCGLKLILLGFAVAVAALCHRYHNRLELPYTMIVSGVHLALSVHYVLGQLPSA
jgi:hypothetical protein